MYIAAAAWCQLHPEWSRPASQEGSHEAPWAVVTFHEQRGRTSLVRPYRRVWPFRDRAKAVLKADEMLVKLERGAILAAAICSRGRPERVAGDLAIVERWMALRRGINKGADPWSSAGYGHREMPARRNASYGAQGASKAPSEEP